MAPVAPQRHEIPTHLDVEDRAFYGLTARQVMWLTVGCAGGYGLWAQWPDLPAGHCASPWPACAWPWRSCSPSSGPTAAGSRSGPSLPCTTWRSRS